MKVRADVAELLKTGKPERQIAQELGIDRATVRRTREALGLPAPRRGKRSKYPSLVDVLRGNSEPLDDEHVRWTGYRDARSNTPLVLHGGQRIPAPRAAFQLHYGREPVGKPLPTCGMHGCIAGEHLADRPMREANARVDVLFDAIFGGSV
ncbi:helix-turn-helix domain-containing protein [Streptomyces sp. NPDC014889]|uniref:helix-turn-helix domain-containing protein n=1 Tax=Streptomyces sp. NPDC014889 TaxID=3364928 RepID=UPI00370367B4